MNKETDKIVKLSAVAGVSTVAKELANLWIKKHKN